MIRTQEATGKTVDEARAAACTMLGVQADDLNVSYEVLEMPKKTGFLGLKLTPAKVRVSVEEPDAPKAAPAAKPAAEKKPVPKPAAKPVEELKKPAAAAPAPAAKQEVPAPAVKQEPVPAPAVQPAPAVEAVPVAEPVPAPAPVEAAEEIEVPINIEENAKIKAAVEYLREVIGKMGIENVEFTAVQKGEAVIIHLDGEKLGALIGRRGETMESLSYLASLVANRMDGDYIKLGLDVAGYRGKRESDLTALAQRIGAKVRKTGRSFAMEPMNPYERRIIHSAISKMEGLRSESKGEGRDRCVVIYSTAPDAQTENTYYERHSRPGRGNNGGRGGYRGNNYRSNNRYNSDRGERRYNNSDRDGESRYEGRSNGGRGGYRSNRPSYSNRGARNSGVPERTYEPRNTDTAAPVAPKRTERVDDFADLSFGKIEL